MSDYRIPRAPSSPTYKCFRPLATPREIADGCCRLCAEATARWIAANPEWQGKEVRA